MGNKQSGFLSSVGLESIEDLRGSSITIEQKPYYEWTVDDVCTWLRRVELEAYVSTFRANKTDGAALGSLDAQMLSTFYNIHNFTEVMKVIRKVEELKKTKFFKEPPYMRIMKKFLAASQNHHSEDIEIDKVREFAQYLANPDRLKEKYLNPDYAQTEQTLNALNGVNLTISSRPTRFNPVHVPDSKPIGTSEPEAALSMEPSSSSSTSAAAAAAMIANYVDADHDYDSDDYASAAHDPIALPSPSGSFMSPSGVPSLDVVPKTASQNMPVEDLDFTQEQIKREQMFIQEYRLKDSVKVKLVLVEISKSRTQKTFRKFLSPVMAHLDLSPKFGMFHSALIVGPWYLEWNASSLCVPRKCYSTSAMLVASLPSISRLNLREAINKIAEVVVDWNVNKTYSRKENNCQQFVEAVCANLGINLNIFSGQMKSYLDAMRNNGVCDMVYTIPELLRPHFDGLESKSFRTHKELDCFVAELLKADLHFDITYKEDWMLLKSFDRAFWLKKYKFPESSDLQPHQCPFGDPSASASLIKEWF